MTRINANIDPADLCDQHLIAEYREMVRIPNFVLGGSMTLSGVTYFFLDKQPKINWDLIPNRFKLGPGHVKFFYNKIRFLHHRFVLIKMTMHSRNIKNNIEDNSFKKVMEVRPELYHTVDLDYANSIVIDRIIERIQTMKKVTIHGQPVDKNEYCQRLKNKYGHS